MPAAAPTDPLAAARQIREEITSSIGQLKAKIAASGKDIRSEMERRFIAEQERHLAEQKRIEEARPREAWYRFVHIGIPIHFPQDFSSSNVRWVQYDIKAQSLFIRFWNGNLYRYWTMTEREAASMYNSASKGTWVWDNLRVRGTKLGHRKNYQLVGVSSGTSPKWTATAQAREVHNAAVAGQSAATGAVEVYGVGNVGPSVPYNAIGKFALSKPKMNIGNKQTAPQVLLSNIQP